MVDQERFFRALGLRIKELMRKRGLSQEDMISHGFSARHWQQIEAGRPDYVEDAVAGFAIRFRYP